MLQYISTNDILYPHYDGLLVTEEFHQKCGTQIQEFISGAINMAIKNGAPHYLLTLKTNKTNQAIFAPVTFEHNGITYKCLAKNQADQKSKFLNDPGALKVFRENILEKINFASFPNLVEISPSLNPVVALAQPEPELKKPDHNSEDLLKEPNESQKKYLGNFLTVTASEESLLKFLKHSIAIDFLFKIRVNQSNALSEMAVKNPDNLDVLLMIVKSNQVLLQKFSDPQLFKIKQNQHGEFAGTSALYWLSKHETGIEIIQLLYNTNPAIADLCREQGIKIAPSKTITLRDPTRQEQLKFKVLMHSKNLKEFTRVLAEIDNISVFFNKVIFTVPLFILKTNLLSMLCLANQTLEGPPIDGLKRLWVHLITALKQDPKLMQKIFSSSFFAIFNSPNEKSHYCQNTSAAFWLISNIHSRPLVVAAIKFHLQNKTPVLKNILDNLFLLHEQGTIIQCLLWELKTPNTQIDVKLVTSLILAKCQRLSEKEKWELLFIPTRKSGYYSPFFLLMRSMPLATVVEKIFTDDCDFSYLYADSFYQHLVRISSYFSQLVCPNSLSLRIEGICLLKKIYRKRPDLLQSMTIQQFCREPDPDAGNHSAFYWLSRINPHGIDLIKLILSENEQIKAEFKLEDLIYTSHKDKKSLFIEFYEDVNHEVFRILLKDNPKLAQDLQNSAYPKDPKLKQIIAATLKTAAQSAVQNVTLSQANNRSSFHYNPKKTPEQPETSNSKSRGMIQDF